MPTHDGYSSRSQPALRDDAGWSQGGATSSSTHPMTPGRASADQHQGHDAGHGQAGAQEHRADGHGSATDAFRDGPPERDSAAQATEYGKYTGPIHASVWSNASSMNRIRHGMSSPAPQVASRARPPRTAGGVRRIGRSMVIAAGCRWSSLRATDAGRLGPPTAALALRSTPVHSQSKPGPGASDTGQIERRSSSAHTGGTASCGGSRPPASAGTLRTGPVAERVSRAGGGGEGGIRTHEVFRLNAFQERRHQPLGHLSSGKVIALRDPSKDRRASWDSRVSPLHRSSRGPCTGAGPRERSLSRPPAGTSRGSRRRPAPGPDRCR